MSFSDASRQCPTTGGSLQQRTPVRPEALLHGVSTPEVFPFQTRSRPPPPLAHPMWDPVPQARVVLHTLLQPVGRGS